MSLWCRKIDTDGCYSLVKIILRQFARTRIIDDYDCTMSVPPVCVTSQIKCVDMTMLSQKRPSLVTMEKWAIDDCFCEIVCSGHDMSFKKDNNAFVAINNDFRSLIRRFANDFRDCRNHWQIINEIIGKSPHSWPKIVICGKSCICLYLLPTWHH